LIEKDLKKIKTKINKVKKIYEEHNKNQIKNGGDFNICSILRKHNDEVNLHSKFIYELINPDGSHLQGDKFLRLFINEALELDDFIFEDLKIYREDLTDDNRRIDFTIESSNYLIGIEMKIDATDQDKQMYSYHKELEKRNHKYKKNIKLYYLTKYGSEPTKQSLHLLKSDKYNLLSFNIDIEWWLNKCIEKTNILKLQESINQYLEVVHKITGQTPKELENKMDTLITKIDDIKILHNISQDYPRVWAKKEADFWNELYNKINKMTINGNKNSNNKNLKIDLYSGNSKNDYSYDTPYDEQIDVIKQDRHHNHNSKFGLKILYLHNKYKIEILIYQWDGYYTDIAVNISGVKGGNIKNSNLEHLLNSINFMGTIEDPELIFYAKDTLEPTFELFDDNEFKYILSEYTKEIKKVLKIIDDNKDNIVR
jgi:hypothetical protein